MVHYMDPYFCGIGNNNPVVKMSNIEKKVYLECTDSCSIVKLEYNSEDCYVTASFFVYSSRRFPFWERLKRAWKVLRGRMGRIDEIVLNERTMEKLRTFTTVYMSDAEKLRLARREKEMKEWAKGIKEEGKVIGEEEQIFAKQTGNTPL